MGDLSGRAGLDHILAPAPPCDQLTSHATVAWMMRGRRPTPR